MIFSGEFDHRIDSQGRIAIPARFRDAFKAGIVLAEGIERCVDAYTPDEWTRVVEEITSRPSTSANRTLARAKFGSAYTADLDRQGRVVVPVSLREFAGIGGEAAVIGVGRYLEIWDPGQWADVHRAAREQAASIEERLAGTSDQT